MKNFRILLIMSIAFCLLFIAGCGGQQKDNDKPVEKVSVIIYVPTDDAMGVKPKILNLDNSANLPLTVINALITSQDNNEFSVFPKDLKVEKINIKDGIAYVEFNKEFLHPVNHGSLTERLEIASLVNTLTEFPEIKGVIFMVQGQQVSKLTGHLDFTKPIGRISDMIK